MMSHDISTPVREVSNERAVDEYRIGPVSVSVNGPLSLKFPGAEYAEISVPSLEADVLVIASLADSLADGGCSLGIPRRFVKDARVDRETGIVRFVVEGVRSFTDSTVVIRGRSGVSASFTSVPDGTSESQFGASDPISPMKGTPMRGGGGGAAVAAGGGLVTSPVSRTPVVDVSSQLLWLVTGHAGHASPAHDLVAKAATALHAVASLKHEHHTKNEAARLITERNDRRKSRRKNLQERWEAAEESERQTMQTRSMFMSPWSQQQEDGGSGATPSGKKVTVEEIVAATASGGGGIRVSNGNDARAAYGEQLEGVLIKSILARSPPR